MPADNLGYEKNNGPVETPFGSMMSFKGYPERALTMRAMTKTPSGDWCTPKIRIPATKQEAYEYSKSVLGAEDTCLMIEQNLRGIRVNVTTFTDGLKFLSLPPVVISNDCPELGDKRGDRGCVASTQDYNHELLDLIDNTILKPTLEGLIKNSRSSSQVPSTLSY